MNVILATLENIPAVMRLIAHCITDMQRNGIDQWGDFYPTEDIIKNDIQKRQLHLYRQEECLAGIVTLETTQDAEYDKIQWLNNDGRFLVVHRLAVDPVFQGQGCGRIIMEWAEDYAKARGYTSIRLDAYQGNPAAMRLYESHGYLGTGAICYPYRSLPFNVYEKIL